MTREPPGTHTGTRQLSFSLAAVMHSSIQGQKYPMQPVWSKDRATLEYMYGKKSDDVIITKVHFHVHVERDIEHAIFCM